MIGDMRLLSSWCWGGRFQIWGNWATGSVCVGEFEVAWSWPVIVAIVASVAPMISFCRLLTASRKSTFASSLELNFFLFPRFPSCFAFLEVVVQVLMICRSLQLVVRLLPTDSDCEHFFFFFGGGGGGGGGGEGGGDLLKLVPALHPLGSRIPCLTSLGHGFECSLLQPFPDFPWQQVPSL